MEPKSAQNSQFAPQFADPPPHPAKNPDLPPAILLVDDEAWLLDDLATGLELKEWRVATAGSAAEALERLRRDPAICVLVTDLRMPEMDGFALMRQAQEGRSDSTALEVVVVTGNHDVANATAAMRDGAVDFLAKPYSLDEVGAALDRALRRAWARRDAAQAQARQRKALERADAESANLTRRLAEALDRLGGDLALPDKCGAEAQERLRLLAHELRSPLIPVLGFAELLQDPSHALPPNAVQDYAAEIAKGARLLLAKLDKLLVHEQLNASEGLHEPAPLPAVALAAPVLEALAPLAAARQVALRSTLLPGAVVHGAAYTLRRGLTELLENAILASPQGDEVTLTLETRGGTDVLLVRDHGRGLPPGVLAEPGRPFQPGEPVLSRSRDGLGLGLAIAQRVAVLHGGRLVLRNHEQGGAEASLLLPCS